MLFPLNVDVPMERWPWMNWLLLLTLFLCHLMQISSPEAADQFILGIDGHPSPSAGRDFFGFAIGRAVSEHPLSWIGHMFLHADWMHLIGNALFMWVFGNAVCAKIGNIQYLVAWLALGLAAAVGHQMLRPVPVLGASGAINGIVGVYLVLYPLNDIMMAYFVLYRAGTFVLSGYWMILMWLGFDLWGMLRGEGNVGHVAHVGGFVAGAGLAIALLMVKFIESNDAERTLVDIVRDHRSGTGNTSGTAQADGRSAPHLSHIKGGVRGNAPALQPTIRLHVRLPNGQVKYLPLGEFQRHEAQGKPVNHFMVSEDGEKWITFGQWRAAHATTMSAT